MADNYDNHGVNWINPDQGYDSGFDKEYKDADRHGINWINPDQGYDPGFDKEYKDADRHGVNWTNPDQGYDPGFDKSYRDADQHGMTATYDPNVSQFNAGDLSKFCREVSKYGWLKDQEVATLLTVPDQSLNEVLSARYRNHLGKMIDTPWAVEANDRSAIIADIDLIGHVLEAGRDINDVNIGLFLGQNNRVDAIGLLDSYAEVCAKNNFNPEVGNHVSLNSEYQELYNNPPKAKYCLQDLINDTRDVAISVYDLNTSKAK